MYGVSSNNRNSTMTKLAVVSYAHGAVATMKLATRKLGNLGHFKSYGGMQNYQERFHRLKNQLEFSQSLAVIAVLEQQDVAHAKADVDEELQAMAPIAKIKLYQKSNNVGKPTKKKIVSLLLMWYAAKEDANKKHKGDLIALLSREIETHPERLL
jgi:hypothetical protein